MNIIFLDVDGVLNSELYYESDRYVRPDVAYEKDKNSMHIYTSDIDLEAIDNLNNLISETDSKVVISSTWRNKGLPLLQEIFENRGFKHKLLDVTPHGCTACLRGNEILLWVEKNKQMLVITSRSDFNSYVILDDDSDMLYWQRNNFILIDGSVGLTKTQCYRAKRILHGH